MSKLNKREAFTLIELVVVIAVLGILILLVTPKFLGYIQDAKIAQIKNDVRAYENAVEVAMIDDENYIGGWESVTLEQLEGYRDSNALFDREGLVSEEFTDEHFLIEEELVKSKLEGSFIVSKGGKVYYYDSLLNMDDSIKTQNFLFDEGVNSNQIHTLSISNLSNIENITSNSGNVEIIEVNGNEVTVKLSDGNITRQEQTGGEYLPEDTKFVSGENSPNYNEDGYIGTLEEYLHSGELIPSETIEDYVHIVELTEPTYMVNYHEQAILTPTIIYPNTEIDGFEGELSLQSVEWEFVPQSIQDVFYFDWHFDYLSFMDEIFEDYVIQNAIEIIIEDTVLYPLNQYGDNIVGLNATYFDYSYMSDVYDDGNYEFKGDYYNYLVEIDYILTLDGYTYEAIYEGTITKPEVDTRIYRYQGEVTRPEVDTRTYDDYYQYEITVEYK